MQIVVTHAGYRYEPDDGEWLTESQYIQWARERFAEWRERAWPHMTDEQRRDAEELPGMVKHQGDAWLLVDFIADTYREYQAQKLAA